MTQSLSVLIKTSVKSLDVFSILAPRSFLPSPLEMPITITCTSASQGTVQITIRDALESDLSVRMTSLPSAESLDSFLGSVLLQLTSEQASENQKHSSRPDSPESSE